MGCGLDRCGYLANCADLLLLENIPSSEVLYPPHTYSSGQQIRLAFSYNSSLFCVPRYRSLNVEQE